MSVLADWLTVPTPSPPITVVGIGADGWAGLAPVAQAALRAAQLVLGSVRQLDLLDASVGAIRERYPSPLLPELLSRLDALTDRRVVVLASGDPMFFGVGATLVRGLGAARVRVLAHPSSVSLAAARLGWPLEDLDVVSAVGRPLALLQPALQPGRRVLVLTATRTGAAQVAELVAARGFAAAKITVLSGLGGPDETVGTDPTAPHDPLTVIAVHCGPGPALARTPGLPDDVFDHDGQLTKREVRAVTLAALVPLPGQLLWDVGAGSGSVGIEWMRTHPAARAIAIEPRADRRARIAHNAAALGTPGLQVLAGAAPDALRGLPAPDAVFLGGGATAAGAIETCLAALAPGGRLVANAVTVESEAAVIDWHRRVGGTLTRLAVSRAEPLGGFTAWRPALPITQWVWTGPAAVAQPSTEAVSRMEERS